MLNVPAVVAALLLIPFPALSDPVVSEGTDDGSAEQGQTSQTFFSDLLDLRSHEAFESMLMGILAVAAVGFQFRRKYAALQRGWQRIAATDFPAAPATSSRLGEATDTLSAPIEFVSAAPTEPVSSANLAPVPLQSRRA